ncbi:MAG: thiamine pyrophosphate-dependent enzyme [Chloroflexota bacterium]
MAIKDLPREEYMLPGAGSCPGCVDLLSLRIALKALGPKTVLVSPASCTASVATSYPNSPFNVPVLTMAFAAGGAAASGVEAALKRIGEEDVNVVVWAGDGGTYDIGLQSLSGAMERGTNCIFVCYNNEIYSNTGVQRSGATPFGAWTTTTWKGKVEQRKDMAGIMLAHRLPYMAQASPSYPEDMYRKVQKAASIKGPKYLEFHIPCAPGWRFPMERTIDYGRLAVETGAWALFEAENGKVEFNLRSKQILDGKTERKPIEEYLQGQGRFAHLFKPERDEKALAGIQQWVDNEWEHYRRMVECGVTEVVS